jgi:predicted N-acetyltransferase YhbS
MIRAATPDDIPSIRALMKSEPGFWQENWQADALERGLESASGLAFVWDAGACIQGFICAHDLGFRAYLSELIVAPTARGQGIGRRLVQHVEQILKSRGCTIFIADVWRDAESFYRSLGWSPPDVILLRQRLDANPAAPYAFP